MLDGGEGSDILDGGSGRDILRGGDRNRPRSQRVGCDNDTLRGAADDDTLDGGRGRDLLDGGAGTNDLTADTDRDTIISGLGQNRIHPIRKNDARCGRGGGRAAPGRRPSRVADNRGENGRDRKHTLATDLARPTAIRSHEGEGEGNKRANLAITVVTTPDSVRSAQKLSYSLNVTNAGPHRAHHVTVYDTLAEDVALLTVTARKANGEVTDCEWQSTNDLVCELGRVRSNGSDVAAVTFEAVVDAPAGNVTNSAAATSVTKETDTSDNTRITANTVTDAYQRVVVEASRNLVGESGTQTSQLTFRRLEESGPQITVNYLVEGTAEPSDYDPFPAVVIPANECCAYITVRGREDSDTDAEIIDVKVQDGSNYSWSRPRTARVEIGDNDVALPLVTIAATPNQNPASETGPAPGRFTVTRTPVSAAELVVRFAPSPTSWAQEGSDFNQLAREIKIPPRGFLGGDCDYSARRFLFRRR